MKLSDLEGKLIAVLGYGQEGKATADYLIKHGIKPVLFDQKPWEKWSSDEKEKIKALNVNFIFGPDCFKELAGFDIGFKSPGIRISQVSVKGLQITSQTKWFFQHSPAKIIGVTGTKGKGTTSALIYQMLKSSYQLSADSCAAYLTGNIGEIQPFEILDDLKKDDWIVFELSSFQLQDLDRSPHIGVVLMVTSEHLDYHQNQAEYTEAKAAIAKYQISDDFCVVNFDNQNSQKIASTSPGKKIYFSRRESLVNGVFIENEKVVIKEVLGQHFNFPISSVKLRGKHNLENICAAIAAAVCAGCPIENIENSVKEFKGLEHRLEFVAEKNGIKYYNDSFSTTPETTIAAIESFSEPLIVILGGSSKKSDFSSLGKVVASSPHLKAVVLIGQEASRIKNSIVSAGDGNFKGKFLEGAENLNQVFAAIKNQSLPGDVVLLSPACASFGMFKNYKDRGDQFKKYVFQQS